MRSLSRRLAATVGAAIYIAAPALAFQHDHDAEVSAAGGVLSVLPSGEGFFVYEGEFGEAGPGNFADEPGFLSDDGSFSEGDLVGFDVLASLLYWDGSAFAAVPTDHSLTLSKSIFSVTLDGASGAQSGFDFIEAGPGGEFDEHFDFVLDGPGAPDALTPGAYGAWMTLTSDDYGVSNEIIILLNYQLEEEAFEAGVEAAGALVPEPASMVLLLVLAAGGLARRR